ncbi:MAG: 50S ribosomal protein L10 [Acidimicrobiales bacterium]
MDNPRQEKVAIVTEVKERLEQSSAVVVTEYRGLTVKALADLRRALRPAGGSYKVYKNTLVRRAASDAGVDIESHLLGPTALAFTEQTPDGEPGDVVTVAKVLKDFAKANPDMVIKGGLFEGAPIDAQGINALADVEPREVLLSKLAGLMAAPMQQMAGLLQAMPRDFAYGLQALIEKGGSGEAPAAQEAVGEDAAAREAVAEDAAAAEAPAEDAVAEEPATEEPAEADENPGGDAGEAEENEES